jgi:SAM-dependent methyltransferase
VKAALIVAILCQGTAAIADLLDDGKIGHSDTPWMAWLYLVSLPVSMAAYQVSFQYLVQATMHPGVFSTSTGFRQTALAGSSKENFASAYSIWQRVLPKPMKFRLMVAWYNLMARIDTRGELLFMNHGYDPVANATGLLPVPPDLEPLRYPIQLYDLLASRVDWRDKDALEVSSGLGGGTLWISRAYSPRSLTGLDIAAGAVRKCRQRYGSLGINFEAGDAQAMPFADQSFDIVINIESSLNYPDMAAFLGEVERVLRPGGHFLFADYRRGSRIGRLRAMLSGMGFDIVTLDDITPGILRGLAQEEARKQELISRRVPGFLRATVSRFAGLGTGELSEHHQFMSGRKAYIAAVLRKPVCVPVEREDVPASSQQYS